jgi:hypothetical protein
MAKEYPYFKFIVTEWLTGDIVLEDLETQGLFINICALYWHKSGNLTQEDVLKRYNKANAFTSLSERFLKLNNGKITIDFLDEQLCYFDVKSDTNSRNGKLGGRPKTLVTKPNANRTKSERKAKKSHIEKDKEIDKDKEYILPFNSLNFELAFKKLLTQPKWENKSSDAIEASLKKLAQVSESEAIEAINDAIVGNYQGIFPKKSAQPAQSNFSKLQTA